MAVYLTQVEQTNLKIKVEEDTKKGEVRLVYNGHAFVVCKTTDKGEHVVQLIDADTGVMREAAIQSTCWKR